ncbi:NUDIX hydrolase [Aliarcobacter cryaerophilus]|uniref:NUDIX domain-containing protein n=2 Tax=unclassified Arcobacter TaxID=2593671 RepID=A0AA96D500_9BACT|nr:NUDIX domain-containing protein [Arcobacter sp. AZ-2023]WPD09328.1 NUDIX domain-containing protein [Arcobacter sp. DSM 115954]WNL14159.1 NUDIX domain-containing protein [Arcobacter sp. AZ-2023]WNL19959.1 NUDIX domain-containing protein [Arcobacter sp. AZ-2023]WNL22100.1 NUDIX domain-containing protein [Arcobacter sp. AZ-2023]
MKSSIEYIANFKTSLDPYNGITILSEDLPKDILEFEQNLKDLIQNVKDNKNLIWIYIDIKKSDFIPIATKFGFTFHSCNSDYILLVKVLKENAIVPNLANHTLGVGAVVINSKNEILLIKEIIRNEYYKLPGGHIDDAEMISQALSREVFEETGVVVDFERIISIGHFYPHQFHKSNLYVLCLAKPKSLKIDVKDKKEISEAIWLDLDEMFKRDDIHDYTKTIVKSALSGQGLYKSETSILTHLKNQFELFFVKESKN